MSTINYLFSPTWMFCISILTIMYVYYEERKLKQWWSTIPPISTNEQLSLTWGCHGPDHMVVGFTATYAISAHHHSSCESCSWQGVLDTTLCDNVCQCLVAGHGKVYLIQHYVIMFVSVLWQVMARCTWYNIMW